MYGTVPLTKMYGVVPLTKNVRGCPINKKMHKNVQKWGGGGTDTHEKNFQKTAQYGRVETVFVNV
jgi:hypothetical protein